MALLTTTNFLTFADKLAYLWNRYQTAAGTKTGSPAAAGNLRATTNNMLTSVVAFADYEGISDLANTVNTALASSTAEALFAATYNQLLTALQGHLSKRGSGVAVSIVDLASYLAYYNGGSGGAAYSTLLTPEWQALYKNATGANLAVSGVMSPAIQPDYTSTASANGMGKKTVGGAFVAGDDVVTASYSGVNLIAEVITDITGGSGVIQIQVAGTDNTGATTTTWGGPTTLAGGNNPVAALSGLTVTGAIAADTKSSRLVSSSTGIVVGSVLTINKNLPDQEVVIVEAVADATHITFAAKVAHNAGATIDGWKSTALTPSVGGRRCTHVSGITFTLNSQSAGVVRIAGVQDRVAV